MESSAAVHFHASCNGEPFGKRKEEKERLCIKHENLSRMTLFLVLCNALLFDAATEDVVMSIRNCLKNLLVRKEKKKTF